MNQQAIQPSPSASPFTALQQRAARHPSATAVRARRRGLWLSHTWSQLADEARSLAGAWNALGIVRGDAIVVLGPLGFDLLVALFAADTLGITLELSPPDSAAETRLLQGARWALVDGSHELERLLRHRGPSLQHVFLSEPDLVLDAQAMQGLTVHRLDQLLSSPGAAPRAPEEATDAPPFRTYGDTGTDTTASVGQFEAQPPRGNDRVLADFDPTWSAGLNFILHVWLLSGAELLLPEPLGDAATDRRQARAHVWLAPRERLERFAHELAGRLPSTGPSAALVRAALLGQRTPWAALARHRIKAVLGLSRLRTVVSNADIPPVLVAALPALGIHTNRSGATEPRTTDPVRTAPTRATPIHDGLDGAFARSAS